MQAHGRERGGLEMRRSFTERFRGLQPREVERL
jgi:hypothetical protein